MPRYKLTIEYDGCSFHGWQSQPDANTVQDALQAAFLKLTGESLCVIGSGRTDAGVHALGQVAHVDLPKAYPTNQITGAINYFLKDRGVVLLNAEEVDFDFHARFSAKARQYTYKIMNRPMPLTLDEGRYWHIKKELDLNLMREAASHLVGHHDFNTFRSIRCQATLTMRTVDFLTLEKIDNVILIKIQSKAFLHNQVRIIVGTLKLVGEGKWTVQDVKEALQAKDRIRGGPTAPPEGLYFTKVFY